MVAGHGLGWTGAGLRQGQPWYVLFKSWTGLVWPWAVLTAGWAHHILFWSWSGGLDMGLAGQVMD